MRRSQITPFLVIGSLMFYVVLQLYIASPRRERQTTLARAQNTACGQTVTGNETYTTNILSLGGNIAAQNNPANYKQIRQAYNCANPNNNAAKTSYIPITVIYDLYFLKGNTTTIANNLTAMKQYGLYPIIRVASYMSGQNWIKLNVQPGGTDDANIMGKNLGDALRSMNGFPQPPIVLFGNEPNLDAEWGGNANPEEFRNAFISFTKGMGAGNFAIYFPALSYGGTGNNSPSPFLTAFFSGNPTFPQKIDGAALNIYGQDFASAQSQYNDQLAALNAYSAFFKSPIKTVISELGPIRNGQADETCTAEWQQLSNNLVSGYIKNPLTIATMACFGDLTAPAVVSYDQQTAQLITLNGGTQPNTGVATGGGGNAGGTTTNTTTGAGGGGTTSINFTPQNPAPNTDFSVTTTATTSYSWVYLKIAKQGETNAFWQAANNLADEPSVSQGPPASWTYHIGKGKPATLPAGDYKVTFYSDCDKGCSERASRTLSIGNNKTNETQTPPTKQAAQQQAKPAQTAQTQPQQNPQAVGAKPDAKFCTKLDIRAGNKKYNLVILPAGYASSQDFLNDARIAVSSLNKTNLSPNTRNKINIWAYNDSSINLQAGLCDDRGICLDQGAARNFAQACGGDGYIVIMNDKSQERGISYGACSGEAAITNAMVDGGMRPFPHELGHAIACLNDEYLVGGRIQEQHINCSTDPSCASWQKYQTTGCYQVCNSGDWFRSTPQSTMNSGSSFLWQFNPPSLEGWDNELKNYE